MAANNGTCDYTVEWCTKCTTQCLSSKEVLQTYQDAVVGIESRFIFTGPGIDNPAEVDIAPGIRADISITGTGVIMSDGYILTAASNVMAPPPLNSVANVVGNNRAGNELGAINNDVIIASQVLVTVNNVNMGSVSYVYQATLLGLYGKGDIAVLYICHDDSFNHGAPVIKVPRFCDSDPCYNDIQHQVVHPVKYLTKDSCKDYRRYGKCSSKKCGPCDKRRCRNRARRGCGSCGTSTHPGDDVFVFGYGSKRHVQQRERGSTVTMVEGQIMDTRYLEKTGWITPETMIIQASGLNGGAGMPVLNRHGQLIGMQVTYDYSIWPMEGNPASIVALTWEGMFYPLHKILNNYGLTRDFSSALVPLDNRRTRLFSPGYLGISYEVMDGADYTESVNYNSGDTTSGFTQFNLNSNGQFSSGSACKDIQGIRVTGVAGLNPNAISGVEDGFYYVPGGITDIVNPLEERPLLPSLPESPLLGTIFPGDIIISAEFIGKTRSEKRDQIWGALDGQIVPQSMLDRLLPGDVLRFSYRRASENYGQVHSTEVALGRVPFLVNYPYYVASRFPQLYSQVIGPDNQQLNVLVTYPSFIYPPDQIAGVNLPVPGRRAAGSPPYAPSI